MPLLYPRRRSSHARWTGHGGALALVLILVARTTTATTITVETNLDIAGVDGVCTLREAILAANTDAAVDHCSAGHGPDRIELPSNLSLMQLGADLPPIQSTLVIRGPGADVVTIDGQGSHHPFVVQPAAPGIWVGIENITIAHGAADDGGAIDIEAGADVRLRRVRLHENVASNRGGAVFVDSGASPSNVELLECWVSDNDAQGDNFSGGGLYVTGVLNSVEVNRSTISGNFAIAGSGGGGGAVAHKASLRLDHSTVSGNFAGLNGGGLALLAWDDDATLTVVHSTVTLNEASAINVGYGGGIWGSTTGDGVRHIVFANSIVAGNRNSGGSTHDFYIPTEGGEIGTNLVNFFGSNTTVQTALPEGAPNAAGDYVGTSVAPLDPNLDVLAQNGGFGPDHRPLVAGGTFVVDHGSCSGYFGDQRGYGDAVAHVRRVDVGQANGPASDGCDIGSHERNAEPGSVLALFADGFELGHDLLWTAGSP